MRAPAQPDNAKALSSLLASGADTIGAQLRADVQKAATAQ
jgi:hypothetical protein